MEFNNSAFFAFLFKETKASPIAASSPELTCSDIDIIWELRENIIRIKRERERERDRERERERERLLITL